MSFIKTFNISAIVDDRAYGLMFTMERYFPCGEAVSDSQAFAMIRALEPNAQSIKIISVKVVG